MSQRFFPLLIIAIALFAPGCGNVISETEERIQGRLLLWHSFEEQEAETLNIFYKI